MMYASFYKYTGDDRTINKSLGSPITTLPCFVQGQCSVITPQILLQYNAAVIGCNYMYIDTFGRYYKIDDIVVDEAKQMHIIATVDPGLSSWSEISGCSGSVCRSEMTGVGNIIDEQLPINPVEESTWVESFGSSSWTDLNFILTVK